MKVFISKKTGHYYYYKTTGDYHTKEGILKEADINSGKSLIKANTNREFLVFEANAYDYATNIKRGPQLMTPKDMGYIITRTGIGKSSVVIEAGSGCGAFTAQLARIVDKVKSYDISPENLKLAQKNVDSLDLGDNVEFTEGDLADYIEKEKDIDFLFLDMPDPVPILSKDLSGVKSGRYIVCYVPSISQIQEITKCISGKEDLLPRRNIGGRPSSLACVGESS